MNKYINSEKLIAEIEGRMEARQDVRDRDEGYWPESDFCIRDKEDESIIAIVDSLQQEQPEVDLEREAVMFCLDNGINITPRNAKEIARHFYELGLNTRNEK